MATDDKVVGEMLLGLQRVTFPPGWEDFYNRDAAAAAAAAVNKDDSNRVVPLTDGLILGRTPKKNDNNNNTLATPTTEDFGGGESKRSDGSINKNDRGDGSKNSPGSGNNNIGVSSSQGSSSSTTSLSPPQQQQQQQRQLLFQKLQPQYANLGLTPKIDKRCLRISRKHLVVIGTTTTTTATVTVKLRFLHRITNPDVKVSVNGVDKNDVQEFDLRIGDKFMIGSKHHIFKVVPVYPPVVDGDDTGAVAAATVATVTAAPSWTWNGSWVPENDDDGQYDDDEDDCKKSDDDNNSAAIEETDDDDAPVSAFTTTNRTTFVESRPPSFFNLPLAVEQTYRASLLESGSCSDDPITAYEFLQSQLNVQHRLPPQGSKLCHQLMKVLTFGTTTHSGNVSMNSSSSRMSGLVTGSTGNGTQKVSMSDFVSDDATFYHDDNESGMIDDGYPYQSLSRFYWDPTRQQLALQYYCSLLDVAPYVMIPRLVETAPGQAQWWMTVLDGVDQAISSFSPRNMSTTLQGRTTSIRQTSDTENTDNRNDESIDNAADPDVVRINVRARAQIQFFQLQACAISALTKLLVVSWDLHLLNEKQKSEGCTGLSGGKVEEDDDQSVSSDSSSDDEQQNRFVNSGSHEIDHESLLELVHNIQQFGTNGKGVIQRIAKIIAKLFVTQRHLLSASSLFYYESPTNVDDKKSGKSNQKRSSNPSVGGKNANTSSSKYIGCRSAHYWNLTDKSKEMYYGTVTRKVRKKYEVKFDDGDQCEYPEQEIIAGIELYKKEEGTVDVPIEGDKPDEIEQVDSSSTALFLVNNLTPSVLENLTDAVMALATRLASFQSIVWTITEPSRHEKNGKMKKRKRGGGTETNVLRKERTKMLWDAMLWSIEEHDGHDTNSLVKLWIRIVGGRDGIRDPEVSHDLEDLAGFA